MPLMEFYLYPPKYISSAAIAKLAPPASRQAIEPVLYRASELELPDEKQAPNSVNAIQPTLDGGLSHTSTSPAWNPA